MVKNFKSFVNESHFNLSEIPEITPDKLNTSIKLLETGEKILVFTNWASSSYAIPRWCKAFGKDNYVHISAGEIYTDSFDKDSTKLNLPKAENMLIYVEEIERTNVEIFESLMTSISHDKDNKYVLSVNINDDDNLKDFMHVSTTPAFKDRFNKIVLCK